MTLSDVLLMLAGVIAGNGLALLWAWLDREAKVDQPTWRPEWFPYFLFAAGIVAIASAASK